MQNLVRPKVIHRRPNDHYMLVHGGKKGLISSDLSFNELRNRLN